MRLLVTGASGFVGRGLIRSLAAPGMPIRAAARRPDDIPASAHVHAVPLPDLASGIDWTPLLADIDVVIHLAGIAHAGGIDADRYDRVNRAATQTLAQACAARDIRLVFISSIRAQTGPASDRVLTEGDAPRPTDAYGRSKLAAEDAIRQSGALFTILRPVVMYGAGVKGNVATLLRIAQSPFPLPLAGFTSRRSLLSVDNLAAAIRHALTCPATQNGTYIVADDEPMSLAEMVSAMRRACGREPGLFPIPQTLISAALRALGRGDLWERIGGALVVDTTALRATGWQPVINVRDGLAALAQAASPRKSGTASRNTP